MAPRPSIDHFNKNINAFKKVLEAYKDGLAKLAESETAKAATHAKGIAAALSQELIEFDIFKAIYLALPADSCPEGLTDEKIQDDIGLVIVEFRQLRLKCILYEPATPLASSTQSEGTLPGDRAHSSFAMLPKLKLNKFSGDYAEFEAFYARFKTLVHESTVLSDLERYEYLMNSLEGVALNAVRHFSFSPANYNTALQTLRDRFSNKRRTLSFHANALLGVQRFTDTVDGIRSFLDLHQMHFNSLKNSLSGGTRMTTTDVVYTQFLLSKLPNELRDKFEQDQIGDVMPQWEDVVIYLTSHVKALENAALGTAHHTLGSGALAISRPPVPNAKSRSGASKSTGKTKKEFMTCVISSSCALCSSSAHKIHQCKDFLALTPRERFTAAKSNQLCIQCLRAHRDKCNSPRCKHCQQPHNTLLHFGSGSVEQPAKGDSSPISSECLKVEPIGRRITSVVLATAIVRLQTSPSRYILVRALLDSCSHCSYITEHAAQLLGVNRWKVDIPISGVNDARTTASSQCMLSVCTQAGKYVVRNHPFFIGSRVSSDQPTQRLSAQVVESAKRLVLADPTFHIPSRVDVLLSADVYAKALLDNITSLGDGSLKAVSTVFGSVITGRAPVNLLGELGTSQPLMVSATLSSLATIPEPNLVEVVEKFWTIEEPPSIELLSEEEKLSKQYFEETTIRLCTGRYQVRLPFKKNGRQMLGDSHFTALSRLRALERKFKANPEFKKSYVDFMRDYLAKGHMTLVADPCLPKYFIPHHGIFKTHGDTSKIRVVFDASAKTSNSQSLNSVLLKTPNQMNLLHDVLTLFRICANVFICDIEQMYRQIALHAEDIHYQCILWREEEASPIQTFAMSTVTYGVGPAAHLAIATLRKLAYDERQRFPKAAQVLLEKVLVDDLNGGGDTLEDALHLRDELIALLLSGGFVLKKWASNHSGLLHGIPTSHCVDSDSTRILGLVWDADADLLRYPVVEFLCPLDLPITKRKILAQTAKLYDPCGYISPLVVHAKCFIQHLWRLPLDWDTPIPCQLQDEWIKFQSQLTLLENVRIPRVIACSQTIQIHGFCDASQTAYAAVLYALSRSETSLFTNLIVSRTRVAPLRHTSIPRLELLGAHLLARLCHHYVPLLAGEYNLKDVVLWTDSSIVLDWLNIQPHLLKTFAANRVAQITEWTTISQWRHVPGVSNPADLASRGITSPSEFASSNWFLGPAFLKLDSVDWPSSLHSRKHSDEDLEVKRPLTTLVVDPPSEDLFQRISTWPRAVRVVTLLAKWIFTTCRKGHKASSVHCRSEALIYLARYIQRTAFAKDLTALEHGRIPSTAIQKLAPYLDEHGVLRVKGRLGNTSVVPRTHPVLLPKRHRLVDLLIQHFHVWLGHAGPSLVQYQLSWNYWLLSARQVIRRNIHHCVRCFRTSPRPQFPLMADLPAFRVNPSPPFWCTGMDYCGPFLVKPYHLRKAPVVKVYICVFICMAIKAIHLEVASDLSTVAFLDVLKRFIARRGIPSELHSDSGTNFVGARALLGKELKALIANHSTSRIVREFLLQNSVDFHTIVPQGPHHGGIWERAVQSAKYHLRRVVGSNTLTVSQLSSLCTQIEAILNSRPLTPMSNDPGDLVALSPGHFLVQRPLTALPEVDVSDLSDGSIRHYHLVKALLQRFWKRWHLEYLTTLQARAKWHRPSKNLEVGDIVVVTEANAPPTSWPLGKIVQVFPGQDGVVRKASVETQSGVYSRPAVKLYCLPCSADASR